MPHRKNMIQLKSLIVNGEICRQETSGNNNQMAGANFSFEQRIRMPMKNIMDKCTRTGSSNLGQIANSF